jgi:MFS family permease
MSSTDLKAAGLKSTGRSRGGLPPVVFVLTAGTFLMQTTEFFIAGLLPELASDLRVSVPHAGLLITIFAVGMIIGSPTMIILTLRLQRRLTLMLSLLLFAAGHVLVAVSPSFEVIFAARFVTACATGAFWSVAVVVATRAAGPAAGSRALGVVMGGGSLATVVGVPLGAFALAVRFAGKAPTLASRSGRSRGRPPAGGLLSGPWPSSRPLPRCLSSASSGTKSPPGRRRP